MMLLWGKSKSRDEPCPCVANDILLPRPRLLHKTLHQIGWYSLVIISLCLCSTVGVDCDCRKTATATLRYYYYSVVFVNDNANALFFMRCGCARARACASTTQKVEKEVERESLNPKSNAPKTITKMRIKMTWSAKNEKATSLQEGFLSFMKRLSLSKYTTYNRPYYLCTILVGTYYNTF